MPRNARSKDKSAVVVGRVLRRTREASGITQQDAAMRADMDRAYLSEVENGKRTISVDRFLRICKSLNVPAAQIMGRIEDELPKKRPVAAGLRPHRTM